MKGQKLDTQQDQIDHCAAYVSKKGQHHHHPATWVGNWDIDEMAVGGRPHDSADGVFDLKQVLRSLGERPQTMGVLIPRFTVGRVPRDKLPSAAHFEFMQWSHRLNWYSHGKSIWRPSVHTQSIGGSGNSLWTDVPNSIVLPDGSQRPYLLREDNTTDALFWESPDFKQRKPEKHLVGPKPEWLAHKDTDKEALPLLALPLRIYHFDRRSVAECWRRVAMYHDISEALRQALSSGVRAHEKSEKMDTSSQAIDQVIQGAGLPYFDGSKYDVNCDNGKPTTGELEYDVVDTSLSSPQVSELVRHSLGPEGVTIVKQERADYIQFLQAFRKNLTSWDELAYWLPEKGHRRGALAGGKHAIDIV
jgi:hypothetical protein